MAGCFRVRTIGSTQRCLCMIAACIGFAVSLVACGSESPDVSGADEPQTPLAIFEAQTELYEALFEDPPDFDSAANRMSSSCRDLSSDPAEVVAKVYVDVEVAQSLGLEADSIRAGFSQIRYKIDEGRAEGDDGSSWVYEQGRWRSTAC